MFIKQNTAYNIDVDEAIEQFKVNASAVFKLQINKVNVQN